MASDLRSAELLRRLVAAILIMSGPTLCHAANCPWMTAATASGLLGGDAIASATPASAGQPAVCAFTYQNGATTRALRIEVEVTSDARARVAAASRDCVDRADLRAIGNEAETCMIMDHKTAKGERVVSRVRDQFFTVTLTTTLKDDPLLMHDMLRSKIYTAAEQVAGNLY